VVALLGGRVVFDGSPRELFNQSELLAVTRLQSPPLVELAQRLARQSSWTRMPVTISEFVSTVTL
jgi:hypothetical protein